MLRVSLYPASAHIQARIEEAVGRYGRKLLVTTANTFITAPTPSATAPIPCSCGCTGPMYFDRKVFLFCGPTVFDAAQSKGADLWEYPEMYAEIGLHYLDGGKKVERALALVDPEKKVGNHELCRYCFANGNRKRKRHAHIALQPVGLRAREAVET